MEEIDINCDLGEGGDYDHLLMPLISSCNIACGGHAGNVETMSKTVDLAIANNTKIGAHPSYPDKANFGRKSMQISTEELKSSIQNQVLELQKIASDKGVKIHHVKPHGALYNDAAKDEKIAKIIVESLLEIDAGFSLFVPLNSVISEVAKGKINIIFEGFADRNYEADYSLVSRSKTNAVIEEKEAVFKHVFSMFKHGKITIENGENLPCNAATFCLHSDTKNSVEILRFLHQRFSEENIKIKNT
ncbi:5-oxoprolinase subunit PxpA [Zunongwangia endophytica]|uniref:5-oxoprolinase subunit PxpA n=1 Tax=Zunongwangia endophytica TaxID=1808945 RepID=A0ABV8HCU7_9FLAO|nr:5-oxoprolinase subunit PxpA [Zunongwangia endophytica]MDN3593588.1 5-oxoprolinase subunit PxpA [Zunongwangia endophytica]